MNRLRPSSLRVANLRVALFTVVWLLSSHASVGEVGAALGDCGQPVSTGLAPVATDALFTIGAAVGAQVCDLCVCDSDNSGNITATDALRHLSAAVGQSVALNCPPCASTHCFDSEAPACGGECPDGGTCAPDPEEPDGECDCFNDCELSGAPTCGGSCDAEGPGFDCEFVRLEPTGLPARDLCTCIEQGLTVCDAAAGPECLGICQPGAECVSDGGNGCMCSALPVQPPCDQAAAPGCLGSCDGLTICEPDGGGACTCAPFNQQQETCFDADAPICGGVCSFGETCGSEFGECECLAPCDLSGAPACGGSCTDFDEICVSMTLTLNGETLEFCSCEIAP